MTWLRKWRFPILIGSGVIAAGVLIYFAGVRVSSDKTQGAIGKRDVYRDGQVNSADVATPGSAPVATKAILESSEYKQLAKDPAFQQLLNSSDFAQLTQTGLFMGLMSDNDFQTLSRDPEFALFLKSDLFRNTLDSFKPIARESNELKPNALNAEKARLAELTARQIHDAFTRLHDDPRFARIVKSKAFDNLSANLSFLSLASHQSLVNLLSLPAFRESMNQPALLSLLAQPAFQGILVQRESGGGACVTCLKGDR